jgi:hypothetical protein
VNPQALGRCGEVSAKWAFYPRIKEETMCRQNLINTMDVDRCIRNLLYTSKFLVYNVANLPKYTCPKCGKVGYLVMSEIKDFRKGTFFYRFRMIHATKGSRKECVLTTYNPAQARSRRKGSKK